uniref:GB1/RHD3-type G domain-containing protein n=1 Tax=Bionectria ochroleuca TaxID=29856 RepID=A0A8H7NDC7_BIOOC
MNGHMARVGDQPTAGSFGHGVQVIDEDKEFNTNLNEYLQLEHVAEAGFNYHLISVFGSQSTGKSTLLNNLLEPTSPSCPRPSASRPPRVSGCPRISEPRVPAPRWRRTFWSWTSREPTAESVVRTRTSRGRARFCAGHKRGSPAQHLGAPSRLVPGRKHGSAQDCLRGQPSAVPQGQTVHPRSLLFFVIRDHLGTTPLANLRETLIQDLTKLWSSISKPQGLENSRIEDYFDFGFAALPHKILQGEKFVSEVHVLGSRFTAGHRNKGSRSENELEGGLFLPEYHRRIPADGFSVYAEGIWDQIVNNKDLDLPTQQELLAQFRCDEISREVLVNFDNVISPLEEKQAEAVRLGKPTVLEDLGPSGSKARVTAIKAFELQASRYHKGVYTRKRQELEGKIDTRLKALYQGQLTAAHKAGVAAFSEAVSNKVKAGQKAGGAYEFAEIVSNEKKKTLEIFKAEAQGLAIEGVPWTNFKSQYLLFESELDEVSGKLRKEEMRRLAVRVERWVKSRLGEAIGVEFNKLGSGRAGSDASEAEGKSATEKDLWDRIWKSLPVLSRRPRHDLLTGQRASMPVMRRSRLALGAYVARVG